MEGGERPEKGKGKDKVEHLKDDFFGADSDEEAEPGTARGAASVPASHLPGPKIVVTSSS